MKTYKIAVLGASQVGKSTLVSQYVNGFHWETYHPTIDDSYIRYQEVGERMAQFEVYDTAGCDKYANLRKQCIDSADAFVLVYSLTSRESFNTIKNIWEDNVKMKTDNHPTLVVGCDGDPCPTERLITKEEGESLASLWGCKYMEITRGVNSDAKSVFNNIADLLCQKMETKRKKKKRNLLFSCIL